MKRDSLVLNKSYYAIQVTDWQKSMSLLFQGSAVAVDENLQSYDFNDWVELSSKMKEYEHGFVNTCTLKIAVPEVIRLTKYDSLPKQDVKFTRHNLYEHYNHTCCYCGRKLHTSKLNLDHVIPKSKGGKTNWSNIVLSCIPCNLRKADKTPEEAGMKLMVVPSRPRWQSLTQVIVAQSSVPIPKSWQNLLDTKYWSTTLEHE